ncbi:unnamed protein product [Pleuronectes platessa]|uniref:Uncharacterized protein n=1 Tax=Pleuronectes platessa TaxID=8262 RepID=A0A9N7TLN8_PLEPL|nr:unnamed protein product [Pleuronectes platessa]
MKVTLLMMKMKMKMKPLNLFFVRVDGCSSEGGLVPAGAQERAGPAVLIGRPWGKEISCLAPNQHASLIRHPLPPRLASVHVCALTFLLSSYRLCVRAMCIGVGALLVSCTLLANTHFTHNPWRFLSWSHVSDLIGSCINTTALTRLQNTTSCRQHITYRRFDRSPLFFWFPAAAVIEV